MKLKDMEIYFELFKPSAIERGTVDIPILLPGLTWPKEVFLMTFAMQIFEANSRNF